MKKQILILMTGILMIGTNVFAQGNLEVNGGLGIGTTAPGSGLKVGIVGTNARGLSLTTSMDQDGVVSADMLKGMQLRANITGTASGSANGIGLITDVSSTASTINQAVGGAFIVSLSSGTGGATTVSEMTAGKFDTVFNGGNRNYTVTQGYGFDLILRDNSLATSGTFHMNDYRGININDADNAYSRISADNMTGLWIDKQTLGGTSNYGLVLAGNESGADIVFGPNQEASIYSAAETSGNNAPVGLWAKDSLGNSTQISPHDPVTGEWIFYSKNIKTGRTVRINMEKLVKTVEKLSGEKFMMETIEETN